MDVQPSILPLLSRPFTLTGSGSACRFEYGRNEVATDSW